MKKYFKTTIGLLPYVTMILVTGLLGFYIHKYFNSNEKLFDTITTGVVSGLITAILLFFIQIIWRKNIVVWIENLLYQDVCVEGEWSGIIVPFIGLETIDKFQKEMAWKSFKQRVRREMAADKEPDTSKENTETQDAEIIDDSDTATQKSEPVTAEVVIHKGKEKEDSEQSGDSSKKVKTEFRISPTPIIIRAEIRRSGHNINGRIIEIGGASKVHSYNIAGTFKNLILSGTYETFSKDHMDRGAFSLMLLENGKKLEGFFSSYADGEHRITPMQCILRKRHINTNDER